MDLAAAERLLAVAEQTVTFDIFVRGAFVKQAANLIIEPAGTFDPAVDQAVTYRNEVQLRSAIGSLRDLVAQFRSDPSRFEQNYPQSLDERLLDRAAKGFLGHWSGKAVIGLIILALALLGVGVGAIGVQASAIVKLKNDAYDAAQQAKTATDQAKTEAEQAKATIDAQLYDAREIRSDAVTQAAASITKEIDMAQISATAAAQVKKDMNDRLASALKQADEANRAAKGASSTLNQIQGDYHKIVEAKQQADKVKEETDKIEATISGEKDTLKDLVFTRAVWSVIQLGGWLMIGSLTTAIIAMGLSLWAIMKR